jgi:uncharacterized phage protein (TIGR02218 family)
VTYDAKETSRHEGSPVELYRFTRGSTIYLYTSADTEQTDGSEVYTPTVISRNEIRQSQEDHSGNIEVRVPRDNAVAALFIAYVPSSSVGLTIRRYHRLDDDEEWIIAFIGEVLSTKYDAEASEWVLTCGPVSEAFRRTIPIYLYQPQCNNALYSDACGVSKEAFKVTGTVSAIDGDTITSTAFGAFADGYFNAGYVQHGEDTRFIIDHVGNVLTLMNPFTDLDVSDSVDAYPGCDRTEAACGPLKFNNLENHLGFSRIPLKNPFDTSVEY